MNINKDVTWGYQPVRSSYCVDGDCLVASPGPGRQCVMVWDSKDPLAAQVWDLGEWKALLLAIKEYRQYSHARIAASAMGMRIDLLPADKNEPELRFSYDEWAAFCDGVENGEFDELSSPALVGPTSGRTAATGAVESVPTPAPVVAGMNAAGYAAMSVPAGRPDGDASTVDGANLAVVGRPGSQASEYDVDELADFIAEAHTKGMYTGAWSLARWLLSQGYRRDPSLMEAEAAWQRLTAPLVPPLDTSHAAVDMGWARPDGLVNEAGEVGPANPRSGPTEPAAVDCLCFSCRTMREQAEREQARA